jgi:hypothetical protein
MSAAETVQTFTGIANENEFFSHHYLAEVFKGDIRDRIEAWQQTEADRPDDETARAPFKRLQACAGRWFGQRDGVTRSRSAEDRLAAHRALHQPLLAALGYALQPGQVELQPGLPVPVWQVCAEAGKPPQLLVVPAYHPGQEDDDPLDQQLSASHYQGIPVPKGLHDLSLAEVISEALFGADQPPRYLILVGLDQWLLLDRYKWPNNRVLRFDWNEILDRKDSATLQAAAALLHRDGLAPGGGQASLLESLDENAHKHAFGVSEALKYALREAIELLGNEAARQLREIAAEQKKGFFSGKDQLDAGDLSLECLRLVYRLLFLFYIEARPELGYVPIRKSETYLKGYSLEHLRDLELTPLHTPEARDGGYFDDTLRGLFRLIAHGCGPRQETLNVFNTASYQDVFTLAPLDSRLFDDAATPMLNKVAFPNHVWQQVIKLMSLSGGRGRQQGRVSYQLLSINQLGAVYEALLSYRGFFAAETLFEVQPEARRTASQADEDDDETANDSGGQTGGDLLDSAWFVPESRIDDYKPGERVHEIDEAGHKKLRRYEKGAFIYRLAGRDRQKSASYYTPQSLTRCQVKYALKELLKDKTADDILALTLVEPAMGSAAYLNEAVNQLAEKYLELKQIELGRRLPHDRYARELQKVRMYIADRNVFGVDLNPVAVELAEVSLWLNAIYGEPTEDDNGNPLPPRPARVPWFGYQLFCGNSLIGARREVYPASRLRKKAKPAWYEEAPRRLDPLSLLPEAKPAAVGEISAAHPPSPASDFEAGESSPCPERSRRADEIYHFLLPDPGMAAYKDKVAKSLYPADFERLKTWRKTFTQPLEEHEIARLQQLSEQVDALWGEHVQALIRDRAATEDPLNLWPDTAEDPPASARAAKEATRRKGLLNEDGDLATPYRRLKLVMDYWCALWFWPIQHSASLPTREQWWTEIGAILEGNIVDLSPQASLDFSEPPEPRAWLPEVTPDLFGHPQPELEIPVTGPSLLDKYGDLRIGKLREHCPRIRRVEALAATRSFLHWELSFADVFARRGGFDLVMGNPPWLRVEWNESGILGEANPLFAIRKLSGSELAKLRGDAFERFEGLQDGWTSELEEAEATQAFLNATQNYPLLKGIKANLYKCFLPLAWTLAGRRGVVGLLHPEGPYDDPEGGTLREAVYARLRAHFQFTNEMLLFAEVDNHTRYSVNIYGPPLSEPSFDQLANLFIPATVDACYNHDGNGPVGGYKNEEGKWNTTGHGDRIVRVGDAQLRVFAQLYDEPGTAPRHARLPALHAGHLTGVLEKLANYPYRLKHLGAKYYSTGCFNETYA